jgi:hypothetical protein
MNYMFVLQGDALAAAMKEVAVLPTARNLFDSPTDDAGGASISPFGKGRTTPRSNMNKKKFSKSPKSKKSISKKNRKIAANLAINAAMIEARKINIAS